MKINTELNSITIESEEIDVFIDLINECDYTFLQNYTISDKAQFFNILSTFLDSTIDCINFLKEVKK